MADRERKRAARQKRKTRSAERAATPEGPAEDEVEVEPAAKPSRAEKKQAMAARRERMRDRTEAKNEAAREQLEPLGENERPAVVTVAAAISAFIWIASVLGYVFWDTLREEDRPRVIGVMSFLIVVGAMAYGLWRARYWAVMGFQALLGIVVVLSGINLVAAVTVPLAVVAFALMVGAGVLFWFMVRAMARIQMPERRAPGGN